MAEYHVHNFGCRASQADGDAIAGLLEEQGIAPASASQADVVIINTCSVTEEAERSARAYLRRIRRENPTARIVVTGCYAQRAPQELSRLEGVAAVVGNSHKGLAATIALAGGVTLNPGEQDAPPAQMSSSSAGFPSTFMPPSVQMDSQKKAASSYFLPLAALAAASPPNPGAALGHYPAALPALLAEQPVVLHDAFAHAELSTLPLAGARLRTRPNLKAQDGCSNGCSFCIIPETRGPSRSTPLEACLEEARHFALGHRPAGKSSELGPNRGVVRGRDREVDSGIEMVLSGINLGRWGRDLLPQRTLADLVRALLEQTPLARLRLSSIEPMDWSDELLALFKDYAVPPAPLSAVESPAGSFAGTGPRLARHAHLPLQSGSDTILRRMYRRYRPWHYAAKIERIHALMPGAAIGADVMVGFPGETDALFQESYNFIAALPLTYLHLFPYSLRPGTAAAELHRRSPVHGTAVKERLEALRTLIAAKNLRFRKRMVGQTLHAVTLAAPTNSHNQGSGSIALTDNFLRVHCAQALPANRPVQLRIQSVTADGLQGELTSESTLPVTA